MPRRDHPPATDTHGPNEPCVNDEYVRRVPPGASGTGTVVVGVVHDHPASVRRVKALAAATDPDVLALELPPLAVPLLRRRVRRDGGPVPAVRGRGRGEPASDRDEMAAAAASVVVMALDAGLGVELRVPEQTVPTGRGEEHRRRLLGALAVTDTDSSSPFGSYTLPDGATGDADVVVRGDDDGVTVTFGTDDRTFEEITVSRENPLVHGGAES
ncbi:hypothetical protein BRC94_04635 [Halobacteriales archaeon QS_5_70_17]|nr:MAG: hypothetical protein BRC94_04635 [Halobacteriales archaeon QS_5_70_17]